VSKHLVAHGLFLIEVSGGDTTRARIAALPEVRYIEPNFMVWADDTFPNDPRFGELWGLHNTGQSGGTSDADIDAPAAWDVTRGSGNTVVAVIDSGVNYAHEDLAANMWRNPGEIAGNSVDDDGNGFVDDVYGWEFFQNDNDPADEHSHGTHVSGTIAGVGNNAVGVVGVNWNAKIMALRFLSPNGSGSTADAVCALNYATMMKNRGVNVRVSNNSWGGGPFEQVLYDAINANRAAGMIFVAAAGNSNNNNDSNPSYPCSYDLDNVISVAATNRLDQLAGFSNYGATSVDLGAPGVDTLSTVPNGYGLKSGTSMDAPHVAGTIALGWDLAPTVSYQEVRTALLNGVVPIASLADKTVTGGRVNARGFIDQLRLAVISSTPADGSVVFTAPSSFTVVFNEAFVTSSVQPGDLKVNGIAANSVTIDSPTRLTFGYSTSPVTAQGLQTMSMAQDSITRQRDGKGLSAFTANFRYDLVPLDATGMTPANGSLVQLPLDRIAFDFNEPVDPASVSIDDLKLPQGKVTALSFPSPTRIEFVVAGMAREGTLTPTIPAGAITDSYGNPNVQIARSFDLDFGTLSYPSVLHDRLPLGSRAYAAASPVPGSLYDAADTDSFVLELEPGQTFSLSLTTSAGLQGQLTLRDPAGNVIGTATASSPGAVLRLDGQPVVNAGNYTATVSGVSGTNGGYTLLATLNSLSETESRGGARNDTIATAQPIDAGFTPIVGNAASSTVTGIFDGLPEDVLGPDGFGYKAVQVPYDFENISGTGIPIMGYPAGNTSKLLDATALQGFTFSFYGTTYTQLYVGDNGLITFGGGVGSANNTDLTSSPSQGVIAAYWDALGVASWEYRAGIKYELRGAGDDRRLIVQWYTGERYWDANYGMLFQAILYQKGGLIRLNWSDLYQNLPATDEGASATVGIKAPGSQGSNRLLVSYNSNASPFVGTEQSLLIAPNYFLGPSPDVYSVNLTAGQSVSVTVAGEGTGRNMLELRNAAGMLLASGSAYPNAGMAISDFVAPVTGTYCLLSQGRMGVEYGLCVTRAATFDLENNDTRPAAQDIGHTGKVVGSTAGGGAFISAEAEPNGSLATANDLRYPFRPSEQGFSAYVFGGISAGDNADWDYYRIHAGPGDRLVAALDGVGLADPYLRLFDRNGAQIAEDDDGGASTNSLLDFSGFTYRGDYYVVADSWGSLSGSYELMATLYASARPVPATDEYFRGRVSTGSMITLTTATPGGGAGLFDNLLDPAIQLFDPTGALVASATGGVGDGRNATLTHLAAMTGDYVARVYAENGVVGEYVLTADGFAAASTFSVSSTTPQNHSRHPADPDTLTVDFDTHLLLTSLAAGDLVIDGNRPATAVTVVDGNTVRFDMPPLAEGLHTYTLAAGALTDVRGRPLALHTGDFTIDLTRPIVVSSSILEGGVVPTGTLTMTIAFSEPMRTANLSPDDFTLVGRRTGNIASTSRFFNANGDQLTLVFPNLQDDLFTLTLLSGDGKFEDFVGNDLLDNFVLRFSADEPQAFRPSLQSVVPLGSLIHQSVTGLGIGVTTDLDQLVFDLDAGQTLTVVAVPDSTLLGTVSVSGPAGVLPSATGIALGRAVIVQNVPVITAGTYTVTLGAAGGTAGVFSAKVLLNAAAEREPHGLGHNNSCANAQTIEPSFLELGNGAARAAVTGTLDGLVRNFLGPDAFGYQAINVPFEWEDISTTGTRATSTIETLFTDYHLNGFRFSMYGTGYDPLYLGTYGLINFNGGYSSDINYDLTDKPSGLTFAGFWDNLALPQNGNCRWEVRGSGDNQRFIAQWTNYGFRTGSGDVSFQMILYEATGQMRVNWQDLQTGPEHNEGISATVGIKDYGTQGARRLLVSYNALSPYVGTGKSLLFGVGVAGNATYDYYSFSANAGQKLTLALTGVAPGDTTLDLLDSAGNVLASGASRDNVGLAIADRSISVTGTYYARVSGLPGLDYSLVQAASRA
jgi:subtilisin family serine protease